MQKRFATALCLSLLSATPAKAFWFWDSGIGCAPLDQSCLLDIALSDISGMVDDVSVNNYGKALGKLWPHLDQVTIQKLMDTHSQSHPDSNLGPYINAAIASTPPGSGALQQLSDLLDDPSLAGYLPLDYLGPTLTDAALREDPAATADLAIAKGAVFSQIAIDGLYAVIAWMARNDLPRLQAYLAAHNPQQAVYFSPSTHLFRIAAELCDDGQDGKPLIDIALADVLQTPIFDTERYAVPMRAVVACDGLPAALAALDDMMLAASKDIESQKERGRDGAFMVQRLVKAVNDDGLTPIIRKLHKDGQTAQAEALAGRILAEAQIIISIEGNGEFSIERSQAQARLRQILDETDDGSSSLDPVSKLRWFTTSFAPETHLNPADYAVFAIDPILRLWPDPLAQKASEIALPLLASSEFKGADEVRLKIGIANAQVATCGLSQAALEEVLDQIADHKHPSLRVISIADYLNYLARYDKALPVCQS